MEVPNAIIITLPSVMSDKIPIAPFPQGARFRGFMDASSSSEDDSKNVRPRKRKLENLTSEERLLRKKMKNRVAAQNSRDKKKARMDELEQRLDEIRQKMNEISDECIKLRKENELLRNENAELRLHNTPENNTSNKNQSITSRGTHEFGPTASLNRDPLQKGRDPRLVMAWQAWCCAWGLLLLTSTTQNQSSQGQEAKSLIPHQLCSFLPALPPALSSSLEAVSAQQKWWGPHQSTWNPMKL